YVLFPGKKTDKVTTDLTLTVPTGLNKDVVIEVPAAPAQRNYRTNVLGNLLTNSADFTVVVDPIYSGDNNIEAWNGNVEEPAYDAATKTYTIENAAQLAWLSEESYKTTIEKVTISIVNDINLNGKVWTPVNKLGKPGISNVTIEGNGNTISNFKVEGGKPAGLFNEVTGTIKNLTVEYAEIKAQGTSGALVGQLFGSAINCHAKHVSVEVKCEKASSGVFEDADKAGALIGQVAETAASWEVTNCSVEDATVWGYRDLGAMIGYSNDEDLKGFVGNSAKDVTITVDMIYHLPYEEGKVQNVAEFVGNRPALTGTAENVNIVYDAPVMIGNTPYASLSAALDAATDGAVLKIGDTTVEIPESIAVGGKKSGTVTFEGTSEKSAMAFVDRGANSDGGLNSYADGVNLIFKNVKVVSPAFRAYSGGFGRAASVTFNNCTYEGQYRSQSGKLTFNQCTIDPQDSYIYTDYTDADFIGCTFNCSGGKGIQVYNDGNTTETTINVENCTFTADKVAYTWPGTLEGGGKPVTAIDINSNGEKFVVNIKNTTAAGFGVGEYSGSTMWNIKGGADYVTVNIEGCNEVIKVTPENIATTSFDADNIIYGFEGTFTETVEIKALGGKTQVFDGSKAIFNGHIKFTANRIADAVSELSAEKSGNYTFKGFKTNNSIAFGSCAVESLNIESCESYMMYLNVSNTVVSVTGNKIVRPATAADTYLRYDGGSQKDIIQVYADNYTLNLIDNIIKDEKGVSNIIEVYGQLSWQTNVAWTNSIKVSGNTMSNVGTSSVVKIYNDATFAPVEYPADYTVTDAAKTLAKALVEDNELTHNSCPLEVLCRATGKSDYNYPLYGNE
ncbi:MAG: hypothetical protein IJ328_08155, partial [Muribaculaceae bacterium]|nr:hypothetical protein [Muribaculaceae bacterium]